MAGKVRRSLRSKILLRVTLFTLAVVAAMSATAWEARRQVDAQIEARVSSIAEIFGQLVASSVLAGEAADYERLRSVIESIRQEDARDDKFLAFILVQGGRKGENVVGDLTPEWLVGTWGEPLSRIGSLRNQIGALQAEVEREQLALEKADDPALREKLSDRREIVRLKLRELATVRDALFREILAQPTRPQGLRVYRAAIHDCRPGRCSPAQYRASKPVATVLVGIAYRPFVQGRQKDLVMLLGISLAALTCAALGTWYTTGRVTKPLDALIEAMRDVDRGVFTKRLRIDSGDEIGLLANSFNGMAAGLEEKAKLREERQQLKYQVWQSEKTKQQLELSAQELTRQGERVKSLLAGVASTQVAELFLEGGVDFEGKSKEATVLFADIRGFTSMCERLGPEEIFDLLNDYFPRMRTIVDRYEGCILKFMGDALMAAWNVPRRQEHHALRAVYAGIDMQRELIRINREREAAGKEPIHVGVGINTGELMVGAVGSQQRFDFTVIGDAVNTAQRIESITPAQHLHVSETTYQLVRENIEVVARDPVTLKGKEKPVQIYAVIKRTKKVVDFGQGAS